VKQVLLTRSGVEVREVPAPTVEDGTVLVAVVKSCISVGTEMSGVRESNTPLWKRAMKRPDQVRRLAETAMREGLRNTRNLVRGKLAESFPTGYSAAGRVIAVGAGVDDIAPGDPVACAGAQCAHHAEVIRAPRNLAVPLPEGLGFDEAATVTLGAIALQGIRRAQPSLGETFAVVGLGFIGQLTVQMLKANGCRVIGVDLDRARLDLARAHGLDAALHPDDGDAAERIARLTDGYGADGVIVAAASPSDEVIAGAFRMCRRKARVVLVGDVGLGLKRADIYAKELDFLISTSYGPGRYDRTYEERGLDYPLPYVRWTENRNMAAYLDLLAAGRVRLDGLLGAVYEIDRAAEAYAALADAERRPLVALLAYPGAEEAAAGRRVAVAPARPAGKGRIGVALIGPGGFAKGTHLPILRALDKRFRLKAVVGRKGHEALSVAQQFEIEQATTDWRATLDDPEIDAVVIATRHDTHARLALEALGAGKHVLVEKPLCLTREELAEIEGFFADGGEGKPILLTGFNRRFSPCVRAARKLLAGRAGPMVMHYRVNAGHIPRDHWVQGPEGGGRNLGEACHFYDLFTYLADAEAEAVEAMAIRPASARDARNDNFAAAIRFADGSLASLTYTALGSRERPKERFEIFSDGRILEIDDYRRFAAYGCKARTIDLSAPDKGHRAEILAFADAIRDGGPWPIPLWQQLQASRIALDVEERLGR